MATTNCSKAAVKSALSGILCLLNFLFVSGSYAAPITKVDIFLLFDDTGSFSQYAPAVKTIFSDIVDGIEAGIPGADVGFGVGRFKDYGGSGWDFCSNHSVHCLDDLPRRINGRPFYLNQPVVTSVTAGGDLQRDTLILNALDRSAPGTGGDDPESQVEALWQIVHGTGLDGNGNGTLNGTDGTEVACASDTQVNPDQSGDVPAFSSLAPGILASGTMGGAGFRPDALKIILVATEICSVIPFTAGTVIPTTVIGRYSTESIADFACFSTTPGDDRFGFVSNANSSALNTVPNAVAPKGSASLLQTISELNGSDVRVLAMGPGLSPKPSGSGPGHDSSRFLSALARITGGVDSLGVPLVLDMGAGGDALKQKIVQAVLSAVVIHPGCSSLDLVATLSGLKTGITKQKKLALKVAKLTQSSADFVTTSAKIKKLALKGITVVTAFPAQPTVCQNNACPAVDRSSAIKSLNSVKKKLSKTINTAIQSMSDKIQAKKFHIKAQNIIQTNAVLYANIPDHTNICE